MSSSETSSKAVQIIIAIIGLISAVLVAVITTRGCDSKPEVHMCNRNIVENYPECIVGKWKIIEGELNGKKLTADSVKLISGYLNIEFQQELIIFSGGKEGKTLKVDSATYKINKNTITIKNKNNAVIKIGYIRQDSLALHFSKSTQDFLDVKMNRIF